MAAFVPVDDDEHAHVRALLPERGAAARSSRELFNLVSMPGNRVILNQDKRVVLTQVPKRSDLRMGEKLIHGGRPDHRLPSATERATRRGRVRCAARTSAGRMQAPAIAGAFVSGSGRLRVLGRRAGLVQRRRQFPRRLRQRGGGIENRPPGTVRLTHAGIDGQEAEHRKPRRLIADERPVVVVLHLAADEVQVRELEIAGQRLDLRRRAQAARRRLDDDQQRVDGVGRRRGPDAPLRRTCRAARLRRAAAGCGSPACAGWSNSGQMQPAPAHLDRAQLEQPDAAMGAPRTGRGCRRPGG